MSKLSMRPAPSPNNTNHENLYLKTELVRGARLGQDAAPDDKARQFVGALRRKFKTPRAAMAAATAALGLDEELQQEEELLLRRGMSVRDIQALIDGHVGRSDVRGGAGGSTVGAAGDDNLTGEQIVEKHGTFDQRRRARDSFDVPEGTSHIARKIETMPGEQLSADDDDDDRDDVETSVRDYLRRWGLSEDEIQGAIDAGRSRYRHGHDRHARDVLPRTASGVAERGGSFPGAHISGGRTQPVHAMDEGQKAKLATMYPHLARIEREPDTRQAHQVRDRRSARDVAPRIQNERQRERMYKMFPGMARIGT